MSIFSTPSPTEVFTPGEIPLEKNNVYVSRETSEASLQRALVRNWCPVVYGDYGVGKTTLVMRYFQKEASENRLVYFESAAGLTISKMFETILEKLEYRVEIERTQTASGQGGVGFDVGVLKAEIGGSGSGSSTSKLLISSPTDKGILSVIDRARLVIIVDEMHRATDSFRADLSSFIKVSRTGAKNSSLILVGTNADPKKLVASDPGIDRYIKDTAVKLMAVEEAKELVEVGFSKLKMEISEELKTRTVTIASGAPSTLQTLCLDMAEIALSSGRQEVTPDDLTEAVKRYLEDNSGRMTRIYFTAIETQGSKRYRKQILHAIARLEGDYATMEDLRQEVSNSLGEGTSAQALSGPLRALKEAKHGSIFQNVERETGGEVQNVSSFTDPMMKSFVRFMETLAETELVQEDEVREAIGGR